MVALRKAFEDEDTIETFIETFIETIPTVDHGDNELYEAVEWLKKAGVVSSERPPFSKFFDELVGSNDDHR